MKPVTEKRRSLRAKSAAIIEAAQQTRNRSIWVVDRARNLVHAIRLKRQVAILERMFMLLGALVETVGIVGRSWWGSAHTV